MRIRGTTSSRNLPIVEFELAGFSSFFKSVNACVDTGFEGELLLMDKNLEPFFDANCGSYELGIVRGLFDESVRAKLYTVKVVCDGSQKGAVIAVPQTYKTVDIKTEGQILIGGAFLSEFSVNVDYPKICDNTLLWRTKIL